MNRYSGIQLLQRPIWIFVLLAFFQISAWGEAVQVAAVSDLRPWKANEFQEIQVQLNLPPGFHAYQDQFKILNLKPDAFKAGQIRVKPETEFFDKFSQKNRKGFKNKGVVTLIVEAPDHLPANLTHITFDLRHQICSESVCFLPQSLPIKINISEKAKAAPEMMGASIGEKFQESLESNLLWAFISVFLAGVLTSFTPCIFPMLPITISILGYHANRGNRFHNVVRAVCYVLGIALTYSILGVVAALTGQLFGSALTNKYLLGTLCLLFVLMALSMWDAFELQMPAFIRNRFATAKGHHGLGHAFMMGLVAGIVASPCVGPVLVSILSFVSTTRNALLGFSLLFTFAMGLGLLFIVIGLFSRALHLLPKSGKWMNLVKFLLGACMWGASLYYAQFLMEYRWWLALVAASFVGLSIWKGAFRFGQKNYVRQSFLLALFIFSSTVLLLSFARPEYLSPAFKKFGSENKTNLVPWVSYSDAALQNAVTEEKPVLLDFYADWCAACHELEEKTYTHPEFVALSAQFKLIKFDATDDSPENQKILQKYGVQGLPTVIFINKKGDLLKGLTFTQFIEWADLKPKMQESLK